MATIKFRLSAKTDKSTSKHEVLITFYHGKIYQRAKTNVFVNENYWDSENPDSPVLIPRFRLMNKEQKQLIAELTAVDNSLKEIQKYVQQSFIDAGAGKQPVAADWLKTTVAAFNGFADDLPAVEEKQQSFFEVFNEYVDNKTMSEHRRVSYRVVERVLRRYAYYNKVELTLDNITGDTLRDFEKYLYNEHALFESGKLAKALNAVPDSRTPKPRGKNAVNDIMGKFRAFYRWANGLDKGYKLSQPYTTNNPFNYYSVPKEEYGTPYYITIDERKQLYKTLLPEPLATQRDIFVFQCLIGCRVSDLWGMTKDSVIDGAIEYIPRKTKEGNPVTVRVPLNQTAKEILDRYKDHEGKGLFPFTSQQQYNIDIKAMFKAAGLDRVVTVLNPTTREEEKRPLYEIASSHLARRTFVGNLYKQVQDPNLIGKLSGHVEGSRAFVRYRDIDEEMKQHLVTLLD